MCINFSHMNEESGSEMFVLLVQPENEISKPFLSEFLQTVEHPLVVSTGEDAIEKLFQFKQIALVIVAIDLHGHSGIEVVEQIRASFEKIPIVLLAHRLTIEILKIAQICGCNEVIQEPLSSSILQSLIFKYILQR